MCDYPEFYDVTYPRSRKDRWCVECLVDIAPGTQYAKHTSKWEGTVGSSSMCLDCDAWCKAYLKALGAVHEDAVFTFGELWSAIGSFCYDHLGYDAETGEPSRFYADAFQPKVLRPHLGTVDEQGFKA